MTDLLLPLIILLTVAALLLWGGLRLARRRTHWQTALLLLLVGVMLAIHLLNLRDKLILARWFPFTDCVFYTNLAIPLAGLVVGLAWPTLKLPAWKKTFCLLFVVGLGLNRSYAPIAGPRPAMKAADWHGTICKQTTLSTCVPAASATLLAKAGIKSSEAELAKLCYTATNGSSSLFAYRALKIKTARTEYETVAFVGSATELRQQSFAGGIMAIKLEGASASLLPLGAAHEVMIWSCNEDGSVTIVDPLSGNRLPWTKGEFDRCWPGEGVFLRRR